MGKFTEVSRENHLPGGLRTASEALRVLKLTIMEQRSQRWFSWLIAFLGLLNLATTIFPLPVLPLFRWGDRLFPWLSWGSRPFLLFAGFSLLYLSIGLIRYQRLAWFLVEILLLLAAVLQLHSYRNWLGLLVNMGAALWLFWQRHYFYGRIIHLNWGRSLLFLLAAAGLLLAYGTAVFWLLALHFGVNYSWQQSSTLIFNSLLHFRWLGPKFPNYRWDWFFESLPFLFGFLLAYSVGLLFSTLQFQQEEQRQQWQRARKVIRRFGRSTTDSFKLWPANNQFFFWQHSLVAYLVSGENFLAIGDGVGPREERLTLWRQYLRFSFSQNYSPIWLGISRRERERLRKLGVASIYLSDEALVDLRRSPLAIKDLRNVYNKLRRRGYRFFVWKPPLERQKLGQLYQVSNAWLAQLHRHDYEGAFGSGWVREMVRASWVPVVVDGKGQLAAFLTLQRSFRPATMVVDLMRHRNRGENGLMEFLFSETWLWLAQQGYRWFDLGAAPRSLPTTRRQKLKITPALLARRRDLTRRLAALAYFRLLGGLGRSYRGLRHFKEKFQPHWYPRYLAYYDFLGLASFLGFWLWRQQRKKLSPEARRRFYYRFLQTHNLKRAAARKDLLE